IINELVSNVFKHAFAETEKGSIKVTFNRITGSEKIRLTISDSGKGLPENFEFEEVDSLGMQLINALTNQLDGVMTHVKGPGTTFVLEFKPAGVE
nr:sensor histidine kinase [Bacteroidia bacterium]